MVDSGRFEQSGERIPNGSLDQRRAVAVCKKGSAFRQRAALGGPQSIGKLRTDRNKAVLVELGIAYGQHRILQIDIADRQALRFAEPQSCAIEEQKQRGCRRQAGPGVDG